MFWVKLLWRYRLGLPVRLCYCQWLVDLFGVCFLATTREELQNGAKPTSEGLALAGVHAKSYSGVLFGICQQF